MNRIRLAAALAFAGALGSQAASAHVVAGARVFPVTTTFDDPGVGDELTLPQVIYQRDAGPSSTVNLQFEFDKRITPTTALILNTGYDILSQSGARTRTGFENTYLTGKWQSFTSSEHEAVVSFGVIREFSGNTQTVNLGLDRYGSTAPTVYFGKGANELPVPALRPLAITGEYSYVIPDRRQNAFADNNGNVAAFNGSMSLQYSLPYLQSQVKDVGLGNFFGRLIPLVEADYSTQAGGPGGGNPTKLLIAPGVIYAGDTFQVGVSALIPANRATGHNVGALVQVHFFLDDILPNSLGRPIFQ